MKILPRDVTVMITVDDIKQVLSQQTYRDWDVWCEIFRLAESWHRTPAYRVTSSHNAKIQNL